jgi:Tol biopolymer transport system component
MHSNDSRNQRRIGRCSALVLVTAVCATATLIGSATLAQATPPGKNGPIVFRRYLDIAKTRSALFSVNPDGTNVKQLTRPAPYVIDLEPDWSPNGARIAFERQVSCPAGGATDGMDNTCDRVYTVNAKGKGLKSLVPCRFKVDPTSGMSSKPGIDCVGVDQPAWSPNGSKLAFVYRLVDRSYEGSLKLDTGIWIVNADGTGLHQVTQRTAGTSWDFGPQWSPDGSKLSFFRSDLKLQADAVFTVNADGTGEFQVTPWELSAGNSTDWSPDGQWLLFNVQPRDGFSNLYKAHPDGTGLTNLTKQPAGGKQYLSSSFSPDGTKIVAARTPGAGPEGAADLVVMNSDGSKAHAITRTRLWESAADWGPTAGNRATLSRHVRTCMAVHRARSIRGGQIGFRTGALGRRGERVFVPSPTRRPARGCSSLGATMSIARG